MYPADYRRAFDERLRETGILMLQSDKRIEFLPRVVEQLESLEFFPQLIDETCSAFPDQFHTSDDRRARQAAMH
jgi:predicted SprT family Zn-dependent metalloprotease